MSPGALLTVGGASFPIAAVDGYRPNDSLVVYTPASGSASTANRWGVEAAVVDGYVTVLRDRRVGDGTATRIPSDGVLLSGHGTAADWLLVHATVGAFVRLPDSLTRPGWPTAPPAGSCTSGTVQLTFDDGPSSTTPAILDTLKAAGVTATFYVIGRNAATMPDLVARESREGHAVANHTWTHPDLTSLTGQSRTPTNVWGAEVAVVGSVVSAIDDRATTGNSGLPIPTGGYVLSGHGAARTWLLANLHVGDALTLPAPALGMAGLPVTVGPSQYPVSGVNADRLTDQLVVYTAMTADEQVLSELSRTSEVVASITGRRPTSWRPPGSLVTSHIVDLADSLGLSMGVFDVDSMDWSEGVTAAQVTANVMGGAHDGAVVDLHDTPTTSQALPGIIDGLRAAGFCLR